MNNKLTTKQEYNKVKTLVESLIAEATEKGMLEPEMDNEYTRKISDLSKQMAQYEDEYMDIMPLREKTPLIKSIEGLVFAQYSRFRFLAIRVLNIRSFNKPL